MFTNRFYKKGALAIVSSAVLGLTLGGCGTNAATATVATYNGGTVTAAQMNEQIHLEQLFNPQLTVSTAVKKQVVQQYILYNVLLEQKAVQAGIKVSQSDVNQTAQSIRQSAIQSLYSGNASSFNAKMQSLGLQNSDLLSYVQTLLTLNGYAHKLVNKVSTQAEQQYYEQHLADFTKVSVRHILVSSLPLAQKIATELRAGGSWDQLAKKYSIDPGSKNNGGLYANQNPSQWVLPFEQHAMSQPLGVIGSPFKSQFGYHVMEVISRATQPFAQVQASIEPQVLQQQTNTVMNNVVSALQKQANIKITIG